jgi:hypothetical protein
MTSVTEKTKKGVKSFCCEICDFTTCKKYDYTRHCLTAKHINVTNVTNVTASCEKSANNYLCTNCNKNYRSRNGLWCHSKKCSPDNKNNIIENPPIDTALILKLIQQNENLQQLLVQQSNEKSELINKLMEREPVNNINNNNNNNTTTNNNQKFNLNFFLNETCKDAMNIQDFIENIRITFQDLLTIGDAGFVNGMSDIFVKQLQNIDVSKRPIHCTDSKRDTIYFKEENTWNKDDKENTKLKDVIEKVEYKNVAALREWCNENPDAKVNNTDNNLLRDKIYLQTLQGDDHTRDKIIKNISKEVIVDKE